MVDDMKLIIRIFVMLLYIIVGRSLIFAVIMLWPGSANSVHRLGLSSICSWDCGVTFQY